jgi:hypothetical protein
LTEIDKNGKEVLIVDEEAVEIKSGHYPELLDRSWVATDYLYQFIGSHPCNGQQKTDTKLSRL